MFRREEGAEKTMYSFETATINGTAQTTEAADRARALLSSLLLRRP
jgi:hypothetical protein